MRVEGRGEEGIRRRGGSWGWRGVDGEGEWRMWGGGREKGDVITLNKKLLLNNY